MKQIVLSILLSLFLCTVFGQQGILRKSQFAKIKLKNATAAATEARWNFSRPAAAVAGYNNMVAGSASSVGNVSVTDPATGWTLVATGTQWEPYAGSIAHLTNGDGGYSGGGSPTYTTFPATALANGWLQAGHTIGEVAGTYPLQARNLQSGVIYQVFVISSIKASVNGNLPNGVWYCKFGSASATSQTIAQQSNYTTPALMFEGTLANPGDYIYFGPISNTGNNTDGIVCNAVYIRVKP